MISIGGALFSVQLFVCFLFMFFAFYVLCKKCFVTEILHFFFFLPVEHFSLKMYALVFMVV